MGFIPPKYLRKSIDVKQVTLRSGTFLSPNFSVLEVCGTRRNTIDTFQGLDRVAKPKSSRHWTCGRGDGEVVMEDNDRGDVSSSSTVFKVCGIMPGPTVQKISNGRKWGHRVEHVMET